jgi:hypothetical protein
MLIIMCVLFDPSRRSIENYFSYNYDENKSKNNISCRLKVDNVLGIRAAKITTEKRGYNASDQKRLPCNRPSIICPNRL